MNIEYEIKSFIDDKINEKSTIDYKVQEYDLQSDDKWEMIKDVIAMLNSEEAFGENKYIILGVAEKEFYVKGLKQEMRDDNEYQHLFTYINPRPHVETGKISIKNKEIGYVFIDKNNNKRPYTIAEDNQKYCEGTSFIRRGSINVSLDDDTRENLTLKKHTEKSNVNKIFQDILDQSSINSEFMYKNKETEGKVTIDPSNNNGEFVIGEGLFEFKIKFFVPNNGVARVHNDYNIQVARLKNQALLFDNIQRIDTTELDFSSDYRRCGINDLAVLVNEMGKFALLSFIKITSENHGSNSDMIEFKWKIIG